MESARAYYNRMAQITVILRERHGNRYRPGELARMSKNCFYAGLLPENHPNVIHLKDQPHTTPLDLLKALLEQEENDALKRTWYPPSTSSRMHQRSVTTDIHRPRKGMMDILSALLNWMLTQPRRCPRPIPCHCPTPWMPSRLGIMTGSS